MSFKEKCKFLDKTKGKRPVKYRKTMKGKEPIVGDTHFFCQSDDNYGWITECPEKSPYFKQK